MAFSIQIPSLYSSGEFGMLPFQEADASLCTVGVNNMHKNRYHNILPPDATRVVLQDGEYINANLIDLGGLSMIACQGPIDSTIEDFWGMILQYKPPAILMVTPLIEQNKVKCSKYWPDVGSIATYGAFKVLNTKSTSISTSIVVSRLLVTKKDIHFPSGFDFTVIHHIYYSGMPDFGIADIDEMLLVIGLLISVLSDNIHPFVCHCSAGVGRTGIFAAILRCLKTGEPPVTAIKYIRFQRHGMVQNKKQFRKIREVLQYI